MFLHSRIPTIIKNERKVNQNRRTHNVLRENYACIQYVSTCTGDLYKVIQTRVWKTITVDRLDSFVFKCLRCATITSDRKHYDFTSLLLFSALHYSSSCSGRAVTEKGCIDTRVVLCEYSNSSENLYLIYIPCTPTHYVCIGLGFNAAVVRFLLI